MATPDGTAGFYRRLRKTLQAIEDAEGERPNALEIVRRVEARGLAIGRSSVGRYLNEEGLPGIDSAEALAVGLGESPGWLAFGEGEAKRRALPSRAPLPVEAARAPRGDELAKKRARRRAQGERS